MKKLTITLNLGNAVLAEGYECQEVARILKQLYMSLEGYPDDGTAELIVHGGKKNLRDLNGNKVGYVTVI